MKIGLDSYQSISSPFFLENNYLNSSELKEVKYITSMGIFPNPINDDLFLSGVNENMNFYLIIRSLIGVVLIKQTINESVNVSPLNAGIYFVNIYNKKNEIIYISKFIKN